MPSRNGPGAAASELRAGELVSRRADFPALDQFTWFDNGVVSLTPLPVMDEYIDRIREITRRGPVHVSYPAEEFPRRAASRSRIAAFIGAEADDIAIVRGVSEAYLTILRGLDWQRGDELIISSDEEAALLLPSLHLRDTVGVRLVFLSVEADPQQLVQDLESRITARTRLVAVSHVTTNLGYRLPVSDLCAAARERDVLSFVDLAHSAGLFSLNVPDLGCDFAAVLSYKWMYGPYAAGALWVKPSAVSQVRLRFAGNRSEAFLDEKTLRYELRPTGYRFEFGPGTWPVIHSWATSVDYVSDLTTSAIWERTNVLANGLKNGLDRIDGVRVLTPRAPDRSAALVTFEIDGARGDLVSRQLRQEYNIQIKHVPKLPSALRASVAFFTLEEEVDLLLSAVAEIAGQGA